MALLPRSRITAFGTGDDRISTIFLINLDRQPLRLKRSLRELGRFSTREGIPLRSITRRIRAIEARDGRAVAATADVDPIYRVGDQLHVQPDARLANCFVPEQAILMTRQEIAVARSHIEAWKTVANGRVGFSLILEDDIYFAFGAPKAIAQGWEEALRRRGSSGGPHLLYLSYEDAGGTAERAEVSSLLFRPVRGLWFLSGYVLSREGAEALLRAMPVVGPVDMWMNFRLAEIGALALASPAIFQRADSESANSYSVLPYLARAGIVDVGSGPVTITRQHVGPVLAWSARGEREGLAMALSMLGLRVLVFKGDVEALSEDALLRLWAEFDAIVDAPLTPQALRAALERADAKFLLEADAPERGELERLIPSCATLCPVNGEDRERWRTLCELLALEMPVDAFPIGPTKEQEVFRDSRRRGERASSSRSSFTLNPMDSSPWILPPSSEWRPSSQRPHAHPFVAAPHSPEKESHHLSALQATSGTFPGSLAWFSPGSVARGDGEVQLTLSEPGESGRRYRSGALATSNDFLYGRFEAEIRPAAGAGLVTGFFLHRDNPRQEIDLEFTGDDTRRLLVNVYFNPGDDGAAMSFGYRGSPCRIDLGFDAADSFHRYAIEWRPGFIAWSVDGRIVHERFNWDPTPIPHLPMRFHLNLWAARSPDLAGRICPEMLPATAIFREPFIRS
jgi:GR25 family glycosyltransferase involved in LPS biosynthesis